MAGRQRQHDRRHELHQADQAQVERAAGDRVDLPADRHRQHLETETGGDPGEPEKTLDNLEANYKATSEKARLTALWLYQTSPMEGGTQSTATIQSSSPTGEASVRLILRRHTAWGQNAFLYATAGKGFVCKGDCTLKATFDGKPKTLKAFRPPTGEPALLFRNDAQFIKDMAKTKRITIDVVTVSRGETTLTFETGGFDGDKWAPLPKKK
jgi:hypothetical protein